MSLSDHIEIVSEQDLVSSGQNVGIVIEPDLFDAMTEHLQRTVGYLSVLADTVPHNNALRYRIEWLAEMRDVCRQIANVQHIKVKNK